jgi:ubiquinol-cytochrome c reductase cytochrome b subunit
MASTKSARKDSRLLLWFDKRVPLREFLNGQLSGYTVPRNLNIWYHFGAIALVLLAIQFATGIFLAMYYKPDERLAFDSIHYFTREVNWGWLIRYAHSTGASCFFIVIYLHMFRSLLYGSYKAPRELIWVIGMLLYVALMAQSFMGYVLPWGNMSFWGAQVIVNLFGVIPGIGPEVSQWIRGDYAISDTTLNRFFSLHVIAVPLGLLLLVVLHITALHRVGSNNPEGIEINDKMDAQGKALSGIPFHPYYTVKDVLGVGIFLILFSIVLFFAPTLGGLFLEPDNFDPANTLSTPEHITPVWYFAPYYAILRAIPDQRLGGLFMLLAIASFVLLPWLDRSPVRSIRYKGWLSRIALAAFVVSFLMLGYVGLQPARGPYVTLARLFTVLYFGFFWLMPVYSKIEASKQVPESLGQVIRH